MRRSTRGRERTAGLILPSDVRRLWVGLAIAVLAPIAITPIVRLDVVSSAPAAAYVLAVVAATFFGRLLAAAVATITSVVMLDRFIVPMTDVAGRTTRGLWTIAIFTAIALVVAQILAMLDRAVRAEMRERDRLAFLAEAGDAMSESLDVETTMRRLADALVPWLADWFSVVLLQDEQISNILVVHPDPAKVRIAQELQERFPTDIDAPRGAPAVIRTGRSELIEEITDEMIDALVVDEELRDAVRDLGLRCAMTVPLTARGRTFGAITLVGAETHSRYGPNDLRLAEEIADRAALAIDIAYLFESESRARTSALEEARRNAVLKDVTAAFGRASTVDEVTTAMLEQGIRLAGATAGTVGIVTEDGERVELAGISGYEVDDHPYWHSFRLDEPLPMSHAILERRPILLSTTAERDRRYPALRGRGEQRDHALVCLPLLLGADAIGGFSASYPPGTAFGDEDLTFLRALGEQCAQAIDRVRSVQRERETRGRFDALADASRGLARSLDLETTAATVVRIATRYLGSRAQLYMREGDAFSLLAETTIGGGDDDGPTREAHPSAEIVTLMSKAIEEGRPRLLESLGADRDGSPGVILPLSIADAVLGALVVTGPSRDFRRKDELEFAREVARRMARAIENARLYRERDYVARTLQQSLLPPTLPEVPGIEIAALLLPAIRGYEVGGDFYDVFRLPGDRWAAVIGDVCGKGVEAATLTGLARHTLRAISDPESPSRSLQALNAALLRERIDGRFCTVAYVAVEPAQHGARLRIASGGHLLPHLVSAAGETRTIGQHGTLLGVIQDPRLTDIDVTLGPGEALVMFTDGILRKQEALGEDAEGLVATLGSGPPRSAAEIVDRLSGYVQELIAEEQDDDIAILVLFAVPD